MVRALAIASLGLCCSVSAILGQATQPIVAVHDSEFTRALESMAATADTPTGPGTTNKQWWTTDWHYFVMPESVKEALRSDGTVFTVVGDSNIISGTLLTNGVPKYPIVISLASEAIRNDEIAPLTNYVAAGGFLLVGSSAFTRTTNGTTRGDFAFANELGVHMVVPGLTNWASDSYFAKSTAHRLVDDIPGGQLTWRMPSYSEEILWGISPSHPFLAPHAIWQVQAAGNAMVVATGDNYPYLVIKPFGNGYFIYHAAFQPLIGHGGFAPGMYAYMIFRRAIEWAFEAANLPIPKLSPWPYPYDAAFMVRHDLENFTNEISDIEASAQVEYSNGAKGDYYFCTGTVREDVSTGTRNNIIANLRRAVTNYGATIGPHNGGSKNPNNPSLVRGQYDYWHWGPDEALDVTGSKGYAFTSVSNSFKDVEGWLSGTGNGSGLRTWVSPYFNATREDSYDIQKLLSVKVTGDQKLTPFPHWTLSTQTSGKRYACLSEPVSDWFVGGLVAQSLEPWHPPGVHTSETMHNAVDFYYDLGALINIYSHTLATGLGDAGGLVADYITYCVDSDLHPRMWAANAVGVYQWWQQRSNAQISVSYASNSSQSVATVSIRGAGHTNTAVEVLLPPGSNSFFNLQVVTNGTLAGGDSYRTNGQVLKVRVGTSVTNVVITYGPLPPAPGDVWESFDGVTAPALPTGWSTSASGAQLAWVTRTTTSDTSPNAAYVPDATALGLSDLVSPSIAVPAGQTRFSFRHNYSLECDTQYATNGFDGGVLEIRIGSGSFTDVLAAGGSFVNGGYNRVIDTRYGNPLAGRQAWSGTNGGFITTTVNLPAAAAGQNIQLRWRCGTDNDGSSGGGWYIDTLTITNCTCACCWNTPPLLPTQTDRTIDELSTLTVTNLATDADLPTQTLTYSLLAAPSGAGITNGVISWTPTEAQGPGTYNFTTKVIDSGFPAMSATNSFAVVVINVNSAPVLPTQTNRTILELTTLTVVNTATDSDVPANALAYSLLAGPTNATISYGGVITWTPTEAQGPGTNTFTTRVVDNGVPPLSATNAFTVVVNESNSLPVLAIQNNLTIAALTTLAVTNTGTDPDLPANTLAYYLLVGPTNATINTNTGIITWTPTEAQDRTTNVFTTIVTDYNPWAVNAQHLSATNSFTVLVLSGTSIALDSTALVAEGCLPTNNVIDPGETITMLFALKNVGGAVTTNLVATLLPTNGVTTPSEPQPYGALVAGGAAVSQSFTFTASGTCGGMITPTLQLQDGAASLGKVSVSLPLGQVGNVLTQNFDGVTVPALPSGWTTSATNAAAGWITTNSLASSAPNAAFSADASNIGINELASPAIVLPLGSAQLSFMSRYDLENDTAHPTNGWDGGVLEMKIGTNAFTDILVAGGSFVSGGYNCTIDTNYQSPLAGRRAWSGNSGGYVSTVVTLPSAAAGQTIRLRWRCGTDTGGVSGSGWRIDSVGISGAACSCCLAITSGPANLTNCLGTTAEFSITATGTGLGYQWYKNSGVLAGRTNSNLMLTNIGAGDAGTYSVVVSSECGCSVTNGASLTLNEDVAVLSGPVSATNCSGTVATFDVLVTGTGLSYQWYKGDGALSGQTNSNLVITNVGSGDAGSFSVVVSGACGGAVTNDASLTVNQNAAVLSGPVSVTNLPGTTASFSVTATGTGLGYQWYKGSDSLAGQTNSDLVLTNVSVADEGTYSVVVCGMCGAAMTNSASLTLSAEFLIVSTSVTNGVIVITWNAVSGQNYKLQYKETLDGTNWNDVPPSLVATGSEATVTDSVGSAAQRFYRVVLVK